MPDSTSPVREPEQPKVTATESRAVPTGPNARGSEPQTPRGCHAAGRALGQFLVGSSEPVTDVLAKLAVRCACSPRGTDASQHGTAGSSEQQDPWTSEEPHSASSRRLRTRPRRRSYRRRQNLASTPEPSTKSSTAARLKRTRPLLERRGLVPPQLPAVQHPAGRRQRPAWGRSSLLCRAIPCHPS